MSHADLAEEPDTSVASPPSWPHTLLVAVGWGVAAALCAGIAWTAGAVAARHMFGVRVPGVSDPLELTALCAGCGLLVGLVAGFALVRPGSLDSRLGVVAAVGVVGCLTGALGGGLSEPMMGAFGSIPPEVSSGLAWAAAGLFAGLAGGIGRRFWPEPGGERYLRAVGWAITGALAGALVWAGAAVVAELRFEVMIRPLVWEMGLAELIMYFGGTVAGGGLFAGAVVGLLSAWARRVVGRGLDSAIRLGLLGGLTGLLGGALAPLLVVRLGQSAPPEVGFGLAGAVAGLIAGLVGHVVTLRLAGHDAEADDEAGPAEGRVTPGARHIPAAVPMLRLLPVLAVAVLTLVAAMATFPPGTRVVLIAVGVLGLAVAYVQAGQERRIRELERRLRQAQDAPPVTASPG